jgi:TetR/AcrR family transcriptional regulator, fatty acid metabolism regulator protein
MRKKEGNKDQDILNAAITVFAQNGFHAAKISKIAELAGVATGSVYRYYENKEDILRNILETIWLKLINDLATLSGREDVRPDQKLDGLIDILFDLFTSNPAMAIVFVNEQNLPAKSQNTDFQQYSERFLDLGEEIVKEGINLGVFNTNIDVKILRNFVYGGVRNLLHRWAHDVTDLPLNNISQEVKFLLKHGVLNSATGQPS